MPPYLALLVYERELCWAKRYQLLRELLPLFQTACVNSELTQLDLTAVP